MKVHGIGIMHSQNSQVALSLFRSGGSLEQLKLVKMKGFLACYKDHVNNNKVVSSHLFVYLFSLVE
jgi:hypothetical protein